MKPIAAPSSDNTMEAVFDILEVLELRVIAAGTPREVAGLQFKGMRHSIFAATGETPKAKDPQRN